MRKYLTPLPIKIMQISLGIAHWMLSEPTKVQGAVYKTSNQKKYTSILCLDSIPPLSCCQSLREQMTAKL